MLRLSFPLWVILQSILLLVLGLAGLALVLHVDALSWPSRLLQFWQQFWQRRRSHAQQQEQLHPEQEAAARAAHEAFLERKQRELDEGAQVRLQEQEQARRQAAQRRKAELDAKAESYSMTHVTRSRPVGVQGAEPALTWNEYVERQQAQLEEEQARLKREFLSGGRPGGGRGGGGGRAALQQQEGGDGEQPAPPPQQLFQQGVLLPCASSSSGSSGGGAGGSLPRPVQVPQPSAAPHGSGGGHNGGGGPAAAPVDGGLLGGSKDLQVAAVPFTEMLAEECGRPLDRLLLVFNPAAAVAGPAARTNGGGRSVAGGAAASASTNRSVAGGAAASASTNREATTLMAGMATGFGRRVAGDALAMWAQPGRDLTEGQVQALGRYLEGQVLPLFARGLSPEELRSEVRRAADRFSWGSEEGEGEEGGGGDADGNSGGAAGVKGAAEDAAEGATEGAAGGAAGGASAGAAK